MSEARVLVVEDNDEVAEMLVVFFGSRGLKVTTASDGQSALRKIRDALPTLILLDVGLPDIDGYDLFKKFRQSVRTRYIPVIFLTRRSRKTDRIAGLELGADDFITKPFDLEELFLRVQNAVDRAARENLTNPHTGLPAGQVAREAVAVAKKAPNQVVLQFKLRHTGDFRDLLRRAGRVGPAALHRAAHQPRAQHGRLARRFPGPTGRGNFCGRHRARAGRPDPAAYHRAFQQRCRSALFAGRARGRPHPGAKLVRPGAGAAAAGPGSRAGRMSPEDNLREEIVRIGRLMHAHDLVDGTAGNISARLGPDRLLATPSGLAKGFLEPEQLIVVDMQGDLVSGLPGLRPTSEILMHLEAYRRRPEVNAVVHAHPVTAVALSIAGVSLAECVVPEAVVVLGLIPTAPYATPSSIENQHAIAELIVGHDAIVLQYHGTLTVGGDVHEAYLRLETVEHTAKIIALARLLGGGPPLPPDQVAKLLDTRQAWGFGRPGDDQEFCVACGVCHAQGDHRPRAEPARVWDDSALGDEDRLVHIIADRVRRELSADGRR